MFAALAIGLGHRTVWLGIGFGVMLVFWLYFARAVFLIRYVVVLLMLLMAGGAALVYFPNVAARLGEGFAGITDPYSDDTASWRMAGWSIQLDDLIKQGRLLSGNGLGSYYRWNYHTATFTSVPHNGYVQIILKFGLFGLSIYGLLALDFFRKTLAVRKKLRPGLMKAYIEMGILTFGAAHAYMLGYGIHPIMLIFFAVAKSAANLSQQALRRSRDSRIPRFPQDLSIPRWRFRPHRQPETRPLYSS